jgi:predicted DNA-binding transcriptional regulator YafY
MAQMETNRLSRLSAILTMLQSKQLLTSTQISKKFGISIRTVYRDIRALEESGVPLVTIEGKGYKIMDGYLLPPIMLTEKEANALITLERIALKSKDASLVKETQEAMAKIKSVMRLISKEKSELLEKRLVISKNFNKETTSSSLLEFQLAVTNYELIEIKYQSESSEISTRIIEPFAIYHNIQEDWTVIAYCRLRKDFRWFRLDRIIEYKKLGTHFKPHKQNLMDILRIQFKIN